MGIPHDTPFLFRFRGPGSKIYGPRPLFSLARYYAERSDCTCAPTDAGAAVGLWRPVCEVVAEMLPAPPVPATAQQLKRLARLGVAHSAEIDASEADALIDRAKAALPPTAGQMQKAGQAKIIVPPNATRGAVDGLLDERVRVQEAALDARDLESLVKRLRAKGIAVAEQLSVDDAQELKWAWEDVESARAEARRECGLAVPIPAGITLEGMRELYGAICDTIQAAGLWEANLEGLAEGSKQIPRMPRARERRAVMLELFERVRQRTWRGDTGDDLRLAWRALGVGGGACAPR